MNPRRKAAIQEMTSQNNSNNKTMNHLKKALRMNKSKSNNNNNKLNIKSDILMF